MKIISFFNHKGGVSKTTSTYHLGWMLTNKNQKVLLVDTDSQCNLTLTVIGQDNYEAFVTEHPHNNIKSGLSAAFESRIDIIKPVECMQVKNNENLFLLPSSFDITEYEVQLGVSFQLTNSFSSMKNLPGVLYNLIKKTANEINADIVLIDLDSNLSAINQALMVSSDFFILPTVPDYFSEMSIKSIARVLPSWEKWAKQARVLFEDAIYPLPVNTPKFLGYTLNEVTLFNSRPSHSSQKIIKKIEETIRDILMPSFFKSGMQLPNDAYHNYCLALVPNFQTLQLAYQENGLPAFELTDAMLSQRNIAIELNAQKHKQDSLKVIYSSFADEVLRLMDYAESH
jgi:cellulose biosynthesis protein BcsQ